jgi:hemerythrin-like domain-containing protein
VALLEDLRHLEEAVRSDSKKDMAALRACLSATRAHVAEHFRMEEQNGYMDVARQREPRLERAINGLATEHSHLRHGLDALIDESEKAANLGNTFRENVRKWIEQVRRHETRENDLVQDAFNLDIGPED